MNTKGSVIFQFFYGVAGNRAFEFWLAAFAVHLVDRERFDAADLPEMPRHYRPLVHLQLLAVPAADVHEDLCFRVDLERSVI